VPAAASLSLFAWLLTLHPTATGRVYAAYGGVYVATAVFWLWAIDRVRPSRWDLLGAGVTLVGMAIIMFGPRPSDPGVPAGAASSSAGSSTSPLTRAHPDE
jgi:small multidrug resistance family-3 protein